MPDDSDKLTNEAMYGASRSMQVLRSHVGIGSFIEYLSVATRTIVQITSVVTGMKVDSNSTKTFKYSETWAIWFAKNTKPVILMGFHKKMVQNDWFGVTESTWQFS